MCGVPLLHCTGAQTELDFAGQVFDTVKVHGTPQEAFACYAKYLVSVLGYTRIGGREFSPPGGGHVRVLTKPSRFGAPLRRSKHELSASANRWLPVGDATQIMLSL
jgi:hypothetical protein